MNWTSKLLNNTAILTVSEYHIDIVLITSAHISSFVSSSIYKSDGWEEEMENSQA